MISTPYVHVKFVLGGVCDQRHTLRDYGALSLLLEPFSDIKLGWGIVRIESTDVNLKFVAWWRADALSHYGAEEDFFDYDIRVNLFRK
jgi:hypothetical protein